MGFCGNCECGAWGGEGTAGCGEMEVVEMIQDGKGKKHNTQL